MKFLTVEHMAKAATLDAVKKGIDPQHREHSGEFEIMSPDGLSKLRAHSWKLANVTFYLGTRQSTRDDHWSSSSASWEFAKGFLQALNIPVKE